MSLVSVVVPAYNRESYLAQALDSVLAQGELVREVIVVDDGSTDRTREIIQGFGPPVRYLGQPNRGPSAARNAGLRLCTGEFIAFQDSDDLWPAGKLARQIDFLRAHTAVDFVFGDMANFLVDPSRENTAEIRNPQLHDYLVGHATDLKDLYRWLVVDNVVPTPTVVARAAAVRRVGFFDEQLRLAEDLEYWLRSLESCRWGFLDAVLLHRRRHETNLVADHSRRDLATLEVLLRAAERPRHASLVPASVFAGKVGSLSHDLGSRLLKRGRFREAARHLARVPSGHPCRPRAVAKIVLARLLQPLETPT
jgi:glycosyltransferase involved in cell wall biosynthesis